jgi:hypothetical protein
MNKSKQVDVEKILNIKSTIDVKAVPYKDTYPDINPFKKVYILFDCVVTLLFITLIFGLLYSPSFIALCIVYYMFRIGDVILWKRQEKKKKLNQ